MEEMLQLILDTLAANGGECDWQTLIEALPQFERTRALIWMREAERRGIARRATVYNAETQTVRSYITSAPRPEGGD